MKKLAIITTHPIQYNAPLFALLAKRGRIDIKVFYTWGESVLASKFDPGFNKKIEWDIPLLEGYHFAFVENIAKDPGSHHFTGIDNPSLISEVENWNADAILVYGWSFRSHFRAMRYFHKKKKVLFRGDSTFVTQTSALKSFIRRKYLSFVYGYVDTCLYVGSNNKIYYQKSGVNNSKLVFAPHAVDNERFARDDEKLNREAEAWKRSLGIDNDKICLLFAGKLVEDKNAQLIIRYILKDKQKKYTAIIVGNGEFERELKRITGNDKRIIFLPFQNQGMMPLVYRLADIFIMPTKTSETWGLAINEAMACSRPVLVSDKCGAAVDLVQEGKNGFVFSSTDERDFADMLGLFGTDKHRLRVMGESSKEIIGNWSLPKLADAVETSVLS
jgi:glycosyltransferase involved in cell wall biosynthesis